MRTLTPIVLAVLALLLAAPALTAGTSDTAFTYQGRLRSGALPANGTFNMDFALWDALSGGAQVGVTIAIVGQPVASGVFSAQLDFGASVYDGTPRWLEITVNGSTLSPRQALTGAPFSVNTRGLVVNADNEVGIGVSDPFVPLHVEAATISPAILGDNSGTGAGVSGVTRATGGTGVFGTATGVGTTGDGVVGSSGGTAGRGVFGLAFASTGNTIGVSGETFSPAGIGVRGNTNSPTAYAGYFTGGRNYFEGNVGIGIDEPLFKLHVERTGGSAIFGDSSTNNGVWGTSAGTSGTGVLGTATATTGANFGVYGQSASNGGRGVFGEATATTGINFGVHGVSSSTGGRGLFGQATASDGVTYGVYGQNHSNSGQGVFGEAIATTGVTSGVRGESASGSGTGVFALASASTGFANGVWGESRSTTGRGVFGVANASSGMNYGVYGHSNSATGFDFYAGGVGMDYGSSSSIRWKSNIRNIDAPLDKLAQLRGVYYDWDEAHGGHHDVGMIAEEVGEVLPEIVNYEENGIDAIGMDYSKMTPLLVEAVKALHDKHEALRAENEQLRERLEKLEAVVSAGPTPVASRVGE